MKMSGKKRVKKAKDPKKVAAAPLNLMSTATGPHFKTNSTKAQKV
jgi:hypothetical protein